MQLLRAVRLAAGFVIGLGCFAAVAAFEIVSLETVSETSSNASIGDLNGDGSPDIVLVKGRHWQLTTKTFLGDGKGHFAAGPPLPGNATKSYSGSLADMTKSGHLDIVLSNDFPDPKLVLVNDGTGHFKVGGTYGDPIWPTRNAAVGDLNGDGYPDIAVANRGMTSYGCYNDGKLHFKCNPLRDTPSAASILIAHMDGDGLNDVIFPCRDACQSRVFFNRDLAGEGRPWGPAKASIRAIAVADLNRDGHADIAAWPERLGCFVYFNDGKPISGAPAFSSRSRTRCRIRLRVELPAGAIVVINYARSIDIADDEVRTAISILIRRYHFWRWKRRNLWNGQRRSRWGRPPRFSGRA
jgi:hypothetical protein